MKNATVMKIVRFLVCMLLCGFFVMPADTPVTAGSLNGGGAAVIGSTDGIGYSSELYDADNGLPTSDANVVFASSDGFIWIGGNSGLIRYDGTTFERMTEIEGITGVNTLFEDSKGRLWIGSNDNGITCLDKGEGTHFSYDNGLPSSSVHAICEDRDGNIVIGTTQGIFFVGDDMKISRIEDNGLSSAYIKGLYTDADGAVCGNTKEGDVFRIKDRRMIDYVATEDMEIGAVCSIFPVEGRPGVVWLGNYNGVICKGSFEDGFENLEFNYLSYSEAYYDYDYSDDFDWDFDWDSDDDTDEDYDPEDAGDTEDFPVATVASALYPVTDPVSGIGTMAGTTWVLTSNMIFYLDKEGEFRRIENIPLYSGIETMTEDFEGNLWFSSTSQGVMKIVANKFIDLTDRAWLEREVVNAVCIVGDSIYIGTDNGIQFASKSRGYGSTDLIGILGNTRINCITKDGNNDIWVSTETNGFGLVQYSDKDGFTLYTEDEGMPSNNILATMTASDGSVLVCTDKGLVTVKNGEIAGIIGKEQGLNNNVILTVEEYDGKYYLGTDGDGIYVIEGGNNIEHISRSDGLTSDVILRIKKDVKRDVLWIVTSNSVQFLQDSQIKEVKGFPYTDNYDIFFDSGDKAWVLASNGIYVADAREMISGDGLEYSFYSVADGLCSVPTGRSYSFLDDNGDLYICGRKGVSCVNIEDFFVQKNDLILSVPYIEADGVRYYHDADNTFRIPSTAEYITVYAFALTYTMHDPMIEYMLEGSDKQSVVLNKSDMMPVRYTNLRGGEHEFRLSVLNSSTRNARQTATFRIVKQRRFYEHWWFYLLCLIAIVVFITELIRLITRRKMQALMKRAEEQKRLFKQTATALVNAIDAKDKYTHGHSSRVADYSRKIAELVGKDEDYCDEIYYAALLHDVGKIGIPESIINKTGRLTDEEYEIIKQHPEKGVQILESISEIPNLSIGANYHHERYDGKGYPSHLKGTDIPEIARIISVADAYDAMTSNRSYRSPIPQQKVREEIVKGSGTQFDPYFARTMLHLIDVDTEYDMKEREEIKELAGKNELIVKEHRSDISEGIVLTQNMTTIRLKVVEYEDAVFERPEPSMVLFDSLDARVHSEEREIKDLAYSEYGELRFDGHYDLKAARKMEIKELTQASRDDLAEGEYLIEAVKIKDHILIRITNRNKVIEATAALPDNSRFAYIGLTGENCVIKDVSIEKSEETVPDGYIARIAEEVSYINVPAGDIPNVQVDGYRTAASAGVPIRDGLQITYHAMSLPTARLVWHCPFIDIFTSSDGEVNGKDYRDLAFMRLDGECWECDPSSHATVMVTVNDSFESWDAWKQFNKEGFDSKVVFAVNGNKIVVSTENAGIIIKHTIELTGVEGTVYAALTGDQCALTGIRIRKS